MVTVKFYSSISSPLLPVVTMVTSEFLFLDLLSRTAGGDVVSVTSNRTHVLSGSAQLEVTSITPSSSPRVSDVPVVAAVSDEGDSVGNSTTASSRPDSSVVSPDLNVAEVKSDSKRSGSEDAHETAVTSGLVDTANPERHGVGMTPVSARSLSSGISVGASRSEVVPLFNVVQT